MCWKIRESRFLLIDDEAEIKLRILADQQNEADPEINLRNLADQQDENEPESDDDSDSSSGVPDSVCRPRRGETQ